MDFVRPEQFRGVVLLVEVLVEPLLKSIGAFAAGCSPRHFEHRTNPRIADFYFRPGALCSTLLPDFARAILSAPGATIHVPSQRLNSDSGSE